MTTGISGAPFDRLLREIDGLRGNEPIVVQHGPSSIRPTGTRCVAFLPFGELNELLSSTRLVITHGGVGSVLAALMHNLRPIVTPRLPQWNEVIDNHQVVFARRMAEVGLITLVEDPSELAAVIAAQPATSVPGAERVSALTADLSSYLSSLANERIRDPADSLRAQRNGATFVDESTSESQ